jgi:hypothetical protein
MTKKENKHAFPIRFSAEGAYDVGAYGHLTIAKGFVSEMLSKDLLTINNPEHKLLLAVLFRALTDYDNCIKRGKRKNNYYCPTALSTQERGWLRRWFREWDFGELSLKTILESVSDYPEQAHKALCRYVNDDTKLYFQSNLFCTRRINKNG